MDPRRVRRGRRYTQPAGIWIGLNAEGVALFQPGVKRAIASATPGIECIRVVRAESSPLVPGLRHSISIKCMQSRSYIRKLTALRAGTASHLRCFMMSYASRTLCLRYRCINPRRVRRGRRELA